MYMLIEEPRNAELREAFNVLDEVYGVDPFPEGGAIVALENTFGEDAERIFRELVERGYVAQV